MRKFNQNQYIYFIVFVFILLFIISPCFAEFTISDEKKLGKEFFDKMEENHLIFKNKSLNDYISKIGGLVLAQTTKAPFNFNFYIIDSFAINAFATPGGYIYINKGLILAAENEAQLAGVIAHEIGHANARHVASIIEKSQKLNMAALAATLAGIFLGGGGQTSAAVAAFSLAGSSSLTLRYMRQHEEEADRMGIEYLVRAGYYPTAIIDFLKIMKQREFFSKTMPSYLQTHPGTDDRIIYMDSLILTHYPQVGAKNIIGNLTRIQTLIPLETHELAKKYEQLEQSLKSDPDNVDLLYNIASVEDQLGQTESSLKHYLRALSLSPQDDDILKNIGLIYLKSGKTGTAQDYLLRAIKLNPKKDETILALGKTYFASGQYQEALESYLNLKDKVLNEDTDINYFIAMTYGKLNNKGESHYYFGLHFKKINKKESSLFHFREALNYYPPDSERSIAIKKEIKELESGDNKKPMEKLTH
ncbi:MAG: M48 family metalloprotease [Syntrophaceae bacterium]|nr:M48 family metalloprotease [Syntrophaceae bacterium]